MVKIGAARLGGILLVGAVSLLFATLAHSETTTYLECGESKSSINKLLSGKQKQPKIKLKNPSQ
jgi:hypothetical protein